MQIKHTFLFTFVLGIVWTGFLFAYSTGPDPATNGVFGDVRACALSGCHTSFPVNVPGGSVTISGLPTGTGWTPGVTYQLTVTVQKPGSAIFGYQLSAVGDLTNQQAGTLSTVPGNLRSIVITAQGVQFAHHSNAYVVTSSYPVNWTAPASASFGTVRFNVAGNAANGDFNNSGDFVYTNVIRVAPASTTTGSPTRQFSIMERGGLSVVTDGSGGLAIGYSRIVATTGSTTPAGVAIFGFRQNNILVSEGGVPASRPITAGRIFAEVNGPVNTGLAIANPTNQTATIQFRFTNTAGVDFGLGSTTIGANRQIASFLNEAPWNGGGSLLGTFTFTSDVPVSVIALRGFSNERGEFLTTTLPVADLSEPVTNDDVSLSHFADGGGWVTQVVLVNPTDATITGALQFLGEGTINTAATPITLVASVQGGAPQTASTFNYSIPGRSSFKVVTAGTAPATTAGSVRVNPVSGGAPSSLVIFSYKPGAFTVAEAGVPAMRGNAFRMYVEATGVGVTPGTIQTGLAISNLNGTATTATLDLYNLDGSSTGLQATLNIPGNGHVAKFAHELFGAMPFPFQGVVRISDGAPSGLSVVGLRGRYNERGDFLITTTPPTDENVPASTTEMLFPHLVNGGGWTTQFVLFSGSAGQAANGNLQFVRQDGSPYSLVVN